MIPTIDPNIDSMLPCSALTRRFNIPLYGSAPRYDLWFILEYPTAWGKKAADEVDWFAPLEKRVPTGLLARRVLIRHPQKPILDAPAFPLTFMIAHTTESDPALYEFTLQSPDDIAQIDLNAILNRDPALAANRQTTPLFVMCVNETRDPCCGTYGQPILDLLASQGDINAWGCTHIGGHRFAPTGIVFPHGVCYGHIDPDEIDLITAAAHRQAVYPRKMRGRVCYDEPVQAAAYFLRTALDLDALDAIYLEAQAKIGVDHWEILFGVSGESAFHRLEIGRVDLRFAIRNSCDADAPTKQYEYRLLNHVVL